MNNCLCGKYIKALIQPDKCWIADNCCSKYYYEYNNYYQVWFKLNNCIYWIKLDCGKIYKILEIDLNKISNAKILNNKLVFNYNQSIDVNNLDKYINKFIENIIFL